MVATYALTGFANFGSVGVQLGILGNLCPEKRKMMTTTIFRALLGGVMTSLITACIAGVFYGRFLHNMQS